MSVPLKYFFIVCLLLGLHIPLFSIICSSFHIMQTIRWCKKEKEQFRVLSLQTPPTSSIVYRSKDGCTLTENSVIFYHITKHDMGLEIMCETGYNYFICGLSGLSSSVSIPTSDTIKKGKDIYVKQFIIQCQIIPFFICVRFRPL